MVLNQNGLFQPLQNLLDRKPQWAISDITDDVVKSVHNTVGCDFSICRPQWAISDIVNVVVESRPQWAISDITDVVIGSRPHWAISDITNVVVGSVDHSGLFQTL